MHERLGADNARTARIRVNVEALCKNHPDACEKR